MIKNNKKDFWVKNKKNKNIKNTIKTQ